MTITVRTTALQPSVVNTETREAQTKPSTAALKDGGYVVLWQSSGQEGEFGHNDIYSQRYNALGQKVGTEARVNTGVNGDQSSVDVVGLADGGYVAVWNSYQTSNESADGIYAQRFNASGVAVGAEVRVASAGGETWTAKPHVTALTDGGYAVAWTGGVGFGTTGIFIQRYSSAGAATGQPLLSPVKPVADFSISTGATDDLMVAWNNTANSPGHFVQHFAASGAASTALYSSAGAPAVATLSDGTFVVAAGENYQVRVQRYDASGARLGDSFIANTSTGMTDANVAALPGGGFVVTWSNIGFYAQFFDNYGSRVGEEVLLDPAMGMYGSVVGLPDGGYVATWQRQQYVGTSYEIDVVQRVAAGAVVTPHLTNGIDFAQGDGDNDDFLVGPMDVNSGDQIGGGGGLDRIVLQSSGTYDFRGVQIAGVSSISGTTGDDILIFSKLPDDLKSISGGGSGHDVLIIDGPLDLGRLPTLSNSAWTVRASGSVATFSITAPYDSSVKIDGASSAISIDASTYALTAAERAALFADGVVQISQPGDYTFYSPTLALIAGAPVKVNTYDPSYQSQPRADNLAGGGFVVVWTSEGQDGLYGGVYGQRHDASGAKVGGEFAVNTYTVAAQRDAVVAGLGNGGFVVAWESQGQDGQDFGIYQQRYDASGVRIGGEALVNTVTAGDQSMPGIAALAGGGYVITWSHYQFGVANVYAQRFDSQGARVGAEIMVPTATSGQSGDASVAALDDGGFVVTWNATEVYGQRFGADGAKVGAEFVVNTDTAGSQFASTVTTLPGGGFIVGWLSGYTNYGGREVHTQRFDASGARVGVETRADTAATDESHVTIAVLANGDYLVSWTAHGHNADSTGPYPTIYSDIYAQRYTSSGSPVGGELRLNPTITGYQSDPAIVALSDGGYAALWGYLGTGYTPASHVEMSITSAVDMPVLTPGTDTVSSVGGRPALVTTASENLNSGDSLVGGAGVDRLELGSGKILDITAPLTFSGFEILVGSDEANVFVISAARLADVTHIHGGAQLDTIRLSTSGVTNLSAISLNSIEILEGSSGDDRVIVALKDLANIVILSGGSGGIDTLELAGAGTLDMTGWSFVSWEHVDGSAGDDIFRLGAATIPGVSLSGGGGTDAVVYDQMTAGVNARLSDFVSVENLSGTRFADVLRGDAGANSIYGGDGNDWISGGLGDDSLLGGAGTDTLSYEETTSKVSVNLAFYRADGQGAGIDYVEGFENVIGSAFDDVIEGDFTGNLLDGGAGVDTVSYSQASSGVTVSLGLSSVQETGGGGGDTLLRFENIEGSRYQDRLIGDAGANILSGLAGDDNLVGGLGDDTLDGGAGVDTADYSAAAARITLNLSIAAAQDTVGAGVDVILNIENVLGSAFDDVLIGSSAANSLLAGNGDDILDGGPGDDRLDGGAGVDTASYLNAASGVTVALTPQGAGQATGGGGNDVLVSIENVTGSAYADSLTGDATANVLIGGGGNDTLNGGAGADRLYGGVGNDIFVVDSQADLVFEFAGEGHDIVRTTASFYLYDNIEALELAPGAGNIFGVGNSGDNIITGNEGDNLILGGDGNDILMDGAGNDRVYGEAGDDTLMGDYGDDLMVGGAGNDTINGNDGADRLFGEDGNDVLTGDGGLDILVGGAGDDTLNGAAGPGEQDLMDGGAGNDLYIVDSASDLTFEAAGGGTDTVRSFFFGTTYLYANVENLILAGTTVNGVGNELDNVLTGSAWTNWLLGGAGNDILNGKAGDDVLFGQDGADTFVFERGTGGDVIGDFAVGVDKVRLTGIYSSFAEVQNHMVQNGTDSAIVIGDGDLVVFQHVAMNAFTAGDFLF